MRKRRIRSIAMVMSGIIMGNLFGCAGSVQSNFPEDMTKKYHQKGPAVERRENGEEFNHAYVSFGCSLLQNAKEKGENCLISPLSVMTALAMTANGANSDTLSQMETTLFGSGTLEQMAPELLYYIEHLPTSKKSFCRQANSIWMKDDFGVKDSFLEKSVCTFHPALYQVPFDQETLHHINSWTKQNTNEMIPEILDKIDPDAAMYLINAVVFAGAWEEEYQEYQIQENQIFTTDAGVEQKIRMLNSAESLYLEDDMTTGFVKPYKDGYAFVAFLPKEGITMEDYLAGFGEARWHELLEGMEKGMTVETKIPVFKASYGKEMSDLLMDMGMKDAFDERIADFSNMTDERAYLNRVIHKTFIQVDEYGTKAAAATAVEVSTETCMLIDESTIRYVYLDRPFVYAIIDQQSKLPIFLGVTEQIE